MLVLKTAILSAWSSLKNFLAAVREKILQLVGKFLDWLMKRKTKNPSAGRPTIEDHWLSANRDSLVDMLSCWWAEVGWQLTRATTREELRAALEPLKEHSNRHLISRLLLPISDSATAEEIREERRSYGDAISSMYEADARERRDSDLVREAESAASQVSPKDKEAVEVQLSQRKANWEAAKREINSTRVAQQSLQEKLDRMEAGYAQDELLMFIEKRFIKGKYARTPLNLANAMAGLPYSQGVPFMGVWQSYVRCSNLSCSVWPHHRFRVFETIESLWKGSQKSGIAPVKFFQQGIRGLPRTVLLKTPESLAHGVEQKRSENFLRSYLADNWKYLRLAIIRSLESPPVETERMPYIIGTNFARIQRDPKTAVDLVLAAAERIED
ncbi:MAG TPA: hypothetical protein VJ999_13415 [Candidatus Sulfotelmatobacter sp.]|nr:hypothetical protein [Candidatus Sulfotelmatobacter sp.]